VIKHKKNPADMRKTRKYVRGNDKQGLSLVSEFVTVYGS